MANAVVSSITLINNKNFHVLIISCTYFTANNLNIVAPNHNLNTDEMHISDINSVTVTNSTIETNDDCISIR